jgi:holo-[acyl-carrier protein] synthase
MHILGIGIDLVSVARIADSIHRFGVRFRQRIFTPAELLYCDRQKSRDVHYAGRYAAKEALGKAFGTGLGAALAWLDIHVRHDEKTGAPSIELTGRGRELAAARGVERIFVSISHTRGHAVAQVILAGTPPAAAPAPAAPAGPGGGAP